MNRPTGLDPDGIVEFRKQLFDLRDEFGVTILLNSHLLSEVEQCCDRIAILREGRTVYEGSCRGLEEEMDRYQIDVDDREALKKVVKDCGGSVDEKEGLVLWSRKEDIAGLVAALVEAGVRVRQVTRLESSLEDLYMKVRGKEGGDKG